MNYLLPIDSNVYWATAKSKPRLWPIADSAAKTKAYLASLPAIDLLLCDIRLGDGLSIEALLESQTTIPVIFTTAYDEFALEAFKPL